LSKKIPDIRMRVAVRTDHRIRLMNDVISGIQTVKMHTWEESFANLVKQARR
jgi:ATP-binding cassette subfamily C (CFTR/MRP) protein 4